MTGQQQPFGIAAREQQRLAYLNANRDTLTAAAKQHRVEVQKVVAVLNRLEARTYGKGIKAGCVQETEQQLVEATYLSVDQVRRAIAALGTAGALVTVKPAISPGRNGGVGRAPLRKLTFLHPVEPDELPVDNAGMAVRETANDHAPGTNRYAPGRTPPISTPIRNHHNANSEAPNADTKQRQGGTATQGQGKPETGHQAGNWKQAWVEVLTSDDSGLWPPTPAVNAHAIARHRAGKAGAAAQQVLDATEPGQQLAGTRSLLLRCTPDATPRVAADGRPIDNLPWQLTALAALLRQLTNGDSNPDWLTLRNYLHRDLPTPPPSQPATQPQPPPTSETTNPARHLANRWSA